MIGDTLITAPCSHMRTLPTGCLNSPVLNPKLAGEVRLVLDFGDDQGDNVTAIVYAEFENLMEIDSNKTVQYNIYQV